MKDERQQRLAELLRRGLKNVESNEELPTEWARELFPPERREYELSYYGKESEEKILADTMAVPLQPMRTFGTNGDDWHNKLIFGDNLQTMRTLLQMKGAGKLCNSDGTPGVRLIYIDPPFSTRRDFNGSQDQKAYQDKVAGAEFLEFLRQRIVLLKELLSDDGAIYVHIDQRKGHYVKILMDEIFGEQLFTNGIVWKRTFSHGDTGQGAQHLGRLHDMIFLYRKSPASKLNSVYTPYSEKYLKDFYKYSDPDGRVFRLVSLLGPGGAAKGNPYYKFMGVMRYWVYSENKMKELQKQGLIVQSKKGSVPQKKRYVDEAEGVPLQDIWIDIPPVQGGALEKIDYPTQKPEQLLARIVKISSGEGDIVLDAFAGSGTTCAVAEKLKRRWIGIDCGKLSVYTIQKRMLNLKEDIGNTGKRLDNKPFTLYNAGLYDFDSLRSLPWDGWRFFALQLFGCKDEPHTIRGFKMDGKRQGASVIVFNHFSEGDIGYETVEDIHHTIGKQVGNRCFIIAPRGTFLFQEDYVDFDGVRYYALRIPYSFINELHTREFSALKQPSDEVSVNETVEAIGFDFIKPPIVDFAIKTLRDGSTRLKLRTFESQARVHGKETVGGRETLSTVLIDYDYNGKVFDLDAVHYAHDIENAHWSVVIPAGKLTNKAMFVFLDIYGNESRVIVENKQNKPFSGKISKKRSAYKK